MKSNSSRRDFLSLGVALPLVGMTATRGLIEPAAQPVTRAPSPDNLRYRTLGATGLKVTTVAFGCMLTPDTSVIERAVDLGINLFDTARSYQGGNNERMVGTALKAKRKQVILSTKSGATTKQGALDHLETSLRELGTDYIDIWYLHGRSAPAQVTDELREAQQLAKQQGKIRFTGISTHSGHGELIPWIVEHRAVDVILTTYNFAMDRSIEKLIESASAAGIGIVGMKVMAGGFRRVRPGDALAPKLQREGAMVAALKWVLRNPHVHTTIPSIADVDQLEENFRAMSAEFTPADEKLLARQLEYIAPLYCRMCGECRGTCAQGLPVEDILRALTYAEGYGQFGLGRESYFQSVADRAEFSCNLCPTCTVQCPFGVQVARCVTRAQEVFG